MIRHAGNIITGIRHKGDQIIRVRHKGDILWQQSAGLTQPSVVDSNAWTSLVLINNQPPARQFTCPSGTTKLVVFVGGEGYAGGGGSVAYNGAAMTLAHKRDAAAQQLFAFYLDSPTTGGTPNLTFTGWADNGSKTHMPIAIALANAAAGPFATIASSETNVGSPATQVLNFGASSSIGLYGLVRDNDQRPAMGPIGAGEVLIREISDGSARATAAASYKLATAAGNYTFSWTTDTVSEPTPRIAVEIAGV